MSTQHGGQSTGGVELDREAELIAKVGVEERLKQRMANLSFDVEYDWLYDQYLSSAEVVKGSHMGILSDEEIKAKGIQYAMYQARRLETEENRYPDDWENRRRRVFRRDGYECTNCGQDDTQLHCHHRVFVSQGGSHELHNLTTLCKNCHQKKHPHSDI